MVNALLPTAAFLGAVTVSVELPDPVTDAGLNEALTREGNPLTLRLTLPANPFTPEMVTV
jgi:hypothetical protein